MNEDFELTNEDNLYHNIQKKARGAKEFAHKNNPE